MITNEEAIAKGIRRMIALTGPEASKALKKETLIQNKLNELKNVIESDKNGNDSKDRIKNIVDLSEDVSHAMISSWRKVNNPIDNL